MYVQIILKDSDNGASHMTSDSVPCSVLKMNTCFRDGADSQNTVKPVLNVISRDQNIFPLKPGFHLIKVHYI